MTEKQYVQFSTEIEHLTLPLLEKEIKQMYKTYQKRCAGGSERLIAEKINHCLSVRACRLNKDFCFTPDNVKHIENINTKLTAATKTLFDKTVELDQQMQQILQSSDGFLNEYSIEATLKVDWDSDDIMDEILDEFPGYNSLRTFQTNNTGNHDTENIAGDLDDHNWDIEELSVSELSTIPRFCYASHVLFCHLFYAYSDILRIVGFWNEVYVCWRNKQCVESENQ